MPFTVKHDSVLSVVEVVFSGMITGDNLREATDRCITLQKQMGVTSFLIDINGWDLAASVIDLYDLPATQYRNQALSRNTRIAVLLPVSENVQEAARFYENACRNRGWNALICQDRQGALGWLASAAVPEEPA